MKTLIAFCIAMIVSSGALADSPARPGKPGARSLADVFDFSGVQQAGVSKLVRSPNGISGNLGTSGTGISPGFAYNLVFIVFNEPENCITPDGAGGTMCGETDVFENPFPAVVDVLFVGGAVAGRSGTIHLAGHRKRGDNSNSVFTFFGLPAPGLINPLTAEVHFILRSKGPAVPGLISEQISSYEGGCDFFIGPPGPPAIPVAEGECADVQFSIHMP